MTKPSRPDFRCVPCGVQWFSFSGDGQKCWSCGSLGEQGSIHNSDGRTFVWQGEIVPVRWAASDLDTDMEYL